MTRWDRGWSTWGAALLALSACAPTAPRPAADAAAEVTVDAAAAEVTVEPDAASAEVTPLLARAQVGPGFACNVTSVAMLEVAHSYGRLSVAQLPSGARFALVATGSYPDFGVALTPLSDTNAWQPPVFTAASPAAVIDALALTPLASELVALWHPYAESGGPLRAARIAADGTERVAPRDLAQPDEQLADLTLLPSRDPAAAPGTALVAWVGTPTGGGAPALRYAQLGPDARWVAAPITAVARCADHASVVALDDGFAALWTVETDEGKRPVFGHFDHAGQPRRSATPIGPISWDTDYPQLLARGAGFLAAWSSEAGIQLVELDGDGRPLGPIVPLGATGQATLVDVGAATGVYWRRPDDTDTASDFSGPIDFVLVAPDALAPASAPLEIAADGGLPLGLRTTRLRDAADASGWQLLTTYVIYFHASSATRGHALDCRPLP